MSRNQDVTRWVPFQVFPAEMEKKNRKMDFSEKIPENTGALQEFNAPPDKDGKPVPGPEKKEGIPILYYHSVTDNIFGIEELSVAPAEFEKQMNYLKKNNYTVITFNELKNADSMEKPIIITFDDGYEDNFTYAYPILKKFGFKATIFLCVSVIDKSQFLKSGQILQMKDLINIQSHTMTHDYLSKLTEEKIDTELGESKKILEDLTGKEVDVLAYPYGDYDSRVIKIAKKYYKYAVVSGGGFYHRGDSAYEIKRIYVPRSLDLDGFKNKLQQ
ncbi:MAG: polysaccharide deacetylase family protein [Clostridiales bacterium]|nr:polysaccharide deacetylase family protein [Eubacteriales bacterium]MDH7565074.1 polysaccharide deacetylase family protein [Clostridiales bacterium]